jgi:hypothetical protein
LPRDPFSGSNGERGRPRPRKFLGALSKWIGLPAQGRGGARERGPVLSASNVPPGSAERRTANAIMAAGILVVTGVIAAFGGSPTSTPVAGAPVHGGSGAGGSIWANCTPAGNATCELAPAGETWSLSPTSSWCTQSEGGSWTCASKALILSFSEARKSTLEGVLSVQGTFQIWVIPAVDECELMGDLTHTAVSCAPAVGYVPPRVWNATYPTGPVDLSSLALSWNGSIGVVPSVAWAIYVVDLESSVIEVSSATAVTVVAS